MGELERLRSWFHIMASSEKPRALTARNFEGLEGGGGGGGGGGRKSACKTARLFGKKRSSIISRRPIKRF